MAVHVEDPLLEGRNETPLQRCDRNLVELLQEVRVVQTGVQVLFAFLLIAPLSARFGEVSTAGEIEYFVSLIAAGAAAVLLMAPTAYHRILFRLGDKEYLVAMSNRYTLAGLALVGVAMLGSLMFVTDVLFSTTAAFAVLSLTTGPIVLCWCVLPMMRRRRLRGGTARTASAARETRPGGRSVSA